MSAVPLAHYCHAAPRRPDLTGPTSDMITFPVALRWACTTHGSLEAPGLILANIGYQTCAPAYYPSALASMGKLPHEMSFTSCV